MGNFRPLFRLGASVHILGADVTAQQMRKMERRIQFGDSLAFFLAGSSTLSIRASAALLLSSITSEISHISSFLARYSVSRSCGARVLVPLN